MAQSFDIFCWNLQAQKLIQVALFGFLRMLTEKACLQIKLKRLRKL